MQYATVYISEAVARRDAERAHVVLERRRLAEERRAESAEQSAERHKPLGSLRLLLGRLHPSRAPQATECGSALDRVGGHGIVAR